MSAIHRPLCPEGRSALRAPGLPDDKVSCPEQDRPFVLVATILASAMAFIDGTIVTIALPAIQTDLDASFGALQWVVNGYTLMLGALILVGGGLGDRIGRKRLFVVGIAIFALGSAGCALAPSSETLIAARVIKGIGAALLVPQSLAIISASFPKEIRGRAIGTWAAASAITTALGPPLGGFLIDTLGWRAAFWINIPLSAVAIALALRFIHENQGRSVSGRLDVLGGVMAVLGFGVLTYGLTGLTEAADGVPPQALVALATGVALLLGFVLVERGAEDPLMPLDLFHSRVFSGLNLATLFLYGALGGVLFLLPFDLIARRGLSATEVGLTLLPLGLIIGVLSRMSGGVADRHGPRVILTIGALIVTGAIVILALVLDDYWLGVMLPVLILAVGMGVVVSPLTTAIMNSVSDTRSGAASGVNNAASRIAGLIAIAGLGAVAGLVFALEGGVGTFGTLPDASDPAHLVTEAAFLSAYATAMWLAAGSAFCAALAASVSFIDPAQETVSDPL
ncbi:MAG: MFS transporter [Pseudomonadota bacterium]